MHPDIWEYCGNTEEYPEATRCYCCSLNVVHSREEHDKILAQGWKPRKPVEKVRKEKSKPLTVRKRDNSAALERQAFRRMIWKAS
jgi:hypothetical protein